MKLHEMRGEVRAPNTQCNYMYMFLVAEVPEVQVVEEELDVRCNISVGTVEDHVVAAFPQPPEQHEYDVRLDTCELWRWTDQGQRREHTHHHRGDGEPTEELYHWAASEEKVMHHLWSVGASWAGSVSPVQHCLVEEVRPCKVAIMTQQPCKELKLQREFVS